MPFHPRASVTPLLPANASLEALTAADFVAVARLAETIWRAHYTNIIGSAQIDYMLADRYTPEKLRLYLDADDRWLTLLKIDDRAVGYCSYALTGNPREMKLEQLYLLPELHGRGLGGLLLRHAGEQARMRGRGILMLQTNKRNAAAIAFYRNAGFTLLGETVADIGSGFVMDDYIMEKLL